MALDLSQLPDKEPRKLDLTALPDKAPVKQDEPLSPFMAQLKASAEAATQPFKSALNAVSKPIEDMVTEGPPETVDEAHAAGRQHPSENAGDYERSINYPHTGITELGPSVDVALAGQLAKDVGLGVGKAVGKTIAKKQALKAFNTTRVGEIASMPAQPTLLEGGEAVKPVMKLEQMKGAIRERSGEISPKHIGERGKIQLDLQRAEMAAKDAGDTAQAAKLKLEQKALREEIIRNKGYTTKEGKFVTTEEAVPLQAQAPGEAIVHERPFASTRSGIDVSQLPDKPKGMPIQFDRKDILEINKKAKTNLQVPAEQMELLPSAAEKGSVSKPIVIPAPASKLLPGAEARINKFATTKIADIDKNNPLTSRVEFNKRLGDLESTAYNQYKDMGKQSNLADLATNKIRIESTPGFKPNSIESETLFNYLENPNKGQFLSELKQIDAPLADKIANAEPKVRAAYDDLLQEVNRVRQVNGEFPIARRNNYVTHFNELGILDRLGQLSKAGTPEGEAIANEVLKSSQELASNAKYASVKDISFNYIRRKLDPDFEKDAVTALANYSRAANRYIHMQPVVNELHASAAALEKSAPNAAKYIKDQADFLGGKVTFVDQAAEDLFGREGIRLIKEISGRAKGNVLMGNVNTVLKQGQGLIPTVADNKLSSVAKAAGDLLNGDMDAFALTHSNVLQARAADTASRAIDAGPVQLRLQNLLSYSDYQVAKFGWLTKFRNALSEGKPIQDAVKAAEEFTAMAQSHTSPVNTPPILRSKLSQEMLAFQNQTLANARFISQHLWKGKTTPERIVAATKLGATLYVLQQVEQAVLGKNKESITDYIPLFGSVSRGLTGPGLGVLIDPLKQPNAEGFLKAAIRSAFLVQQTIPAGGVVGKKVVNAIFGEKKRAK